MSHKEIIERLGYEESRNYLRAERGDFNRIADYGHIFRSATKKPCNLKGVYALNESSTSTIPVVYVCDVANDKEAKEAHRLIWNQDSVPFIIINSPECVRVYPGFCRGSENTSDKSSLQRILHTFNDACVDTIINTFSAQAIDSGKVWKTWGQHISAEYRVDWQLLQNLKKLDSWLQGRGDLPRKDSHALIGKYLYLHYLRDRDILSKKKFERWELSSSDVFGRNASVNGLKHLLDKLDEWLNGQVFPIDFSRNGLIKNKHISRVAATFNGDEPNDTDQWQLHLDFKAYDFSYIPIEVLSTVYEQFLHDSGKEEQTSRGRAAGAYYTPIPVVNLMLSELEEHKPLTRGMKVFDPACGSGAFLVQAYRRLIEKEFPPSSKNPDPIELRELLESHFFGLDTDEDACNVAKLSLILTLLDYVHPPDLETDGKPGRKPRLPNLDNNIHCGNFFVSDSWQEALLRKKPDWLVGNPPWKQLRANNLREEDEPVLDWIKSEEKSRPVGNCQMARAFAWRVAEYANNNSEIALFLPAMTLFEEAAQKFRSRFFQEMKVHTVINFSNMRWVLSGNRFTAPSAAFFYHPQEPEQQTDNSEEIIRTYSPLIANQEATRTNARNKRNESWNIIVNVSEIRDVPLNSVTDGQSIPWKVAAWGSQLDIKLLQSIKKRFHSIGKLKEMGLLSISQGLELRSPESDEDIDPVNLPKNAKIVDVSLLKGWRDFFLLPDKAIIPLPKELTHARKGRAKLPLSVCHPPHVIVNQARSFAIYSEDFFIIPPVQIGIASTSNDRNILKALALFLNSDFAYYYEFFLSSTLGGWRKISKLKALRNIPTPILSISKSMLKKWANFYDYLANATLIAYKKSNLWNNENNISSIKGSVVDQELIQELNKLVYDGLDLTHREQSLVHDFMYVRSSLNDGCLGVEACRPPKNNEIRNYAKHLQNELNDFIKGELSGRHDIQIIHDKDSGMICVTFVRNSKSKGLLSVLPADNSEAKELERYRKNIIKEKSQWVYFNRNLRIYDNNKICIFKPMQMMHWTTTQARLDAMDILSESISRRK
ncbi:MAG: N-6 DNA methylase [Sedimentisphaerales bacterium]|nr:N-6 DNA methylase [Sedimentisphaerales bacterium]